MLSIFNRPKYALIEYENEGNYEPIVVETGSWWKLMSGLPTWVDTSPSYASSCWSYIGAYAYREWISGVKPRRTYRRIVVVGQKPPKIWENRSELRTQMFKYPKFPCLPFEPALKVRWF